MTNITEQKLKKIIKESVQEVLNVELMKLRAFGLKEVSNLEQKDIEKRYKKPSHRATQIHEINI